MVLQIRIRPFVNLAIGIGIGTDTAKATISSCIRPMYPKLSRVVTSDESTPPTKSRDTLVLWSRDK